MSITFLTHKVEQKTIRKLRKGRVDEGIDANAILSPIWTKATDRCRKRKKWT